MSLLSPFPSEHRVHGMTPLTFRVGLSSSTSLDTALQLWLGICLLRNSRPCQVDSINRTSCVCLSVCLCICVPVLMEPSRNCQITGVGVTGNCEPPAEDAEHKTVVLATNLSLYPAAILSLILTVI